MRIAFVCQWFPPEPVQVPLAVAQSLAARGHHVEVLTGIPNFPSGSVHPGYKAWRASKETIAEIQVRRYPLFPSHSPSAPKRMLNYLSWASSTTLLAWRALRQADVALVYSSPATAALAPLVWSRIFGTPVVLLIQDLWPDSVAAAGLMPDSRRTRMVQRILGPFVKWTYRRASKIAVISPGMAELLESRGVPRRKLSLIYNWVAQSSNTIAPRRADARARLGIKPQSFVISYAGTQGNAQGLDSVIRAAAELSEHQDIQFVMAGDGIQAQHLIGLAEQLQCSNVQFLGQLEVSDMASVYAASDIQLVSLINDPLFGVTMPSKIQSILAAAKPLIVMAPGDAARVVEQSGAGWAVEPGDVEGLARAVMEAKSVGKPGLEAMGEAGRAYYTQNMSESIGGDRLALLLREAAQLH